LVVSLMLLAPMAFSLLASTMAPSHELVDSNWDQSSWVKYLLRWSQALAVLVTLAAMFPLAFTIKVPNSWMTSWLLEAWMPGGDPAT
jgi:hypothetical protein